MGESSARQLRGEALTDVVFNGSNARQPTALASVELLFDNRDGRVGGKFAPYAELAIRREVTRDAQSTYYLNGTRCRRRDIADVFLGTGFGPRSYSIIEQGMISTLVEAKPDDLRAYLEKRRDFKYRERRRETHNRIRHTVENLERLTDLRDELERQLTHLKRQAKAAERYRELKEQERRGRAELFAIRINDVSAELEQREATANTLETELAKVQSSRQAIETALEKSRRYTRSRATRPPRHKAVTTNSARTPAGWSRPSSSIATASSNSKKTCRHWRGGSRKPRPNSMPTSPHQRHYGAAGSQETGPRQQRSRGQRGDRAARCLGAQQPCRPT